MLAHYTVMIVGCIIELEKKDHFKTVHLKIIGNESCHMKKCLVKKKKEARPLIYLILINHGLLG